MSKVFEESDLNDETIDDEVRNRRMSIRNFTVISM
jgi:hypothetical protein